MIRNLEKKDIDRVIFLEESLLNETIGRTLLLESLEEKHEVFLVYEINELVVGYISAYIMEGYAEILNFCVDENFQRHGIGKKLISKIIELAKINHASNITLEVKETNSKAICFYNHLGFIQIGVRKNYYKDHTNALLLEKKLD